MSGGTDTENQKGSKVDAQSQDSQENSAEDQNKGNSELFASVNQTTEKADMKDVDSDAATLLSLQSEGNAARSDVAQEIESKTENGITLKEGSSTSASGEITEVAVDGELLVSTSVSSVNTMPVQLEAANTVAATIENSNAEPEAAQEITIDQTSHISVSGADTAQLTPVPGLPGVSLISADGGGEDGNAIYLLVTGPVDGDGSGAIAVDAFANATLHSVPVEVSSDGSVVSASHAGVASTEQGGQQLSDPVAEILSTITSVARSAQVNAAQVTSSASTSVSFPTASEMSLAQDILALASSALSSSYAGSTENKTDTTVSNVDGASSSSNVTASNNDLNEDEVKKAAIEQENQQTDHDPSTLSTISTQGGCLKTVSIPSVSNAEMPYFDNADLPHWARYLRDCRQVGDCYTGYVMNEMEMDKVLNMYKKETHSLFAIRQTPSPVREDGTVRLMWKSQYVPYDGIPFINVGRRATVMECEHGPRKKANAVKRAINASSDELMKKVPNLTCPARVFIKKVRKFPEYKVESEIDAKLMRQLQEQALKQLREGGRLSNGEIRFYMQLPLPSAHHYHIVSGQEPPVETVVEQDKHHVDPQVVSKITEVVRQGYTGAFLVRQIARDYVEKELFSYGEAKPPRHDKSYFPPMIEIQNIIQSVQSEMAAGSLKPLPPPATPPLSNKPKKRKSLMKMGDDGDSSDDVSSFKKSKSSEEGDKKCSAELGEASISMESHGESGTGTPNTVSLTLPKSQLENLSVSNLTFDQLQQLAKIGLLALNNTAFGGSPVSMAAGEMEQSDEVNMATGEIQTTDGVTVDEQVEEGSRSLVHESEESDEKQASYKADDEQTVTSEVATEVAASLVTS